ncbi:ABC transporter ATP-binding protein [Bianquea renquensis]|jgi:ABC-type multidrug transport system, ATPase component|uniref:ABC transporter ATP-binding protein n=1 Tax=Bianquea renquensis TaxID=2763661 RepID=A0A926DTB6_9FIRM|nr:ABC transporter ATP-binding protein [Bianquea renquensis]MBC8543417.1 ABC transporter ATP-binding protein [Bianquea renquensis]
MNALEIKGLTKSYGGFTLEHINLVLPCGCIMGLIGENGAGKSTTIRLILDMIRGDSGSITILGKDNQDEMRATKEDIGVVLDEVGFPECLTARQVHNIMRNTYQRWDENVYIAYLNKLDIPRDREFKDFSRGMKMKLGIAVAMSHHPKLLILDEATNGLDPVVRDEVLDMFSEFTRDETHAVLISSHIVSDLEKICDYIAFLHKGKLLLCEEKDVLLEQYGILHCTAEQLRELNPAAIRGKKESAYGVEAIVQRDAIPPGMNISPVSIEELFVFMAKEAK